MLSYSLHFVIAMIMASLMAVLLSHSWRRRLTMFFAVPFVFYTLFYNFNYGIIDGVFPVIMTYVGAVYVCLSALFLLSCRPADTRTIAVSKVPLKIFFFFALQFIGVFYAVAIPWMFDTFPLSNSEAVLFTLFAGVNEGSEEFVISSISGKVLFPAIKIFLVLSLAQLVFAFALFKMDKGFEFVFKKIKFSLNSNEIKINVFQLQKGVTVFLVLYGLVLSLIMPGVVLSTPFRALFQVPVDSELYRDHFVHPDSMKMESPKIPKNLIVIMLESMETNFERYTPEIVNLQKENANFAPGGVSVAGTSWTIAGITSKLCGIPLNMPMGVNEYHGKLPTYLPGAKCLMEILEDQKYNQVYLQGTSGEFTQKRTFWTEHGNVAVHDIEHYKSIKKLPQDYHVFWGFEDRKLYDFAKQELDSLSKKDHPFVLYMLTVDTHQPEGYVDAQCDKDFADENGKFLKSLRCASKMLDEFLSWSKKQSWYENTVVSVMGDHTMAMLSPKANVPPSDSLYWTNFIINSAVTTSARKSSYTSLDMFPTLLEAMGYKLEKRSAGLGRSLYSDSLTMLEIYGRQVLDSLLRERSIQYDVFMFGEDK